MLSGKKDVQICAILCNDTLLEGIGFSLLFMAARLSADHDFRPWESARSQSYNLDTKSAGQREPGSHWMKSTQLGTLAS